MLVLWLCRRRGRWWRMLSYGHGNHLFVRRCICSARRIWVGRNRTHDGAAVVQPLAFTGETVICVLNRAAAHRRRCGGSCLLVRSMELLYILILRAHG